MFNFDHHVIRVGLFAAAACIALPAFAQEPMPFDTPMEVNGMEAACTGVSAEERSASRWEDYSLKVELVGRGAQFLGDADITVAKAGDVVASVHCDGPWVLFKAAPGRYEVTVTIAGHSEKGVGYVPATGQSRIIIRFPNEGGALEPEEASTKE